MQGIRLEPAHSLLRNLSHQELVSLARHGGLATPLPRSRAALIEALTRHLSIDDIVAQIRDLFHTPKKARPALGPERLDLMPPTHGEATVQVYSPSRPEQGQLLLERGDKCLVLKFDSAPLFLENRWPVIARAAVPVPRTRLFSAFVRPGKLHPSAEVPPAKSRPYLLDEGEYQLRNCRLRAELARTGPISFYVTFLRARAPGRQPEYLLEPIV
jgi:hypothetical protein